MGPHFKGKKLETVKNQSEMLDRDIFNTINYILWREIKIL